MATALMRPSLYAASFDVEMAGMTFVIKRIDSKKRILYMNGVTITYDSDTEIYDPDGNSVTIDQLQPGLAIRFDYNKSQRYITGPTATKIWLKSRYPMPVGE